MGNDMKGMDEVWDMKGMGWMGEPRSRTYEKVMKICRSMDEMNMTRTME